MKKANEENVIENNCISDICDVVKEQLLGLYQCLPRSLRSAIPLMKHRLNFPPRYKVIQYLRKCEADDHEHMQVWYHTRPTERYNVPIRYDRHTHGGTLKDFADAFDIDMRTAVSYISVYMTKVEEGIVIRHV